jgi:uncharacterized protein with LGFP repeats
MTRKDFELIADIVATVDNMNTRNEIALNFVIRLHDVNERFDSVRFLKACRTNVKAPAQSKAEEDNSYHISKENFIAP